MSKHYRGDEPTALGDLVARVAEARGLGELLVRRRLEAIWATVVGPALARVSRPQSLEHGRLVVGVASASWNTTLRSMERRLLSVFAERCPELGIKAIRTVVSWEEPAAPVAPEGARDYPSAAELDAMKLSDQTRRDVARTARTISDDDLRQRFERAMLRAQQLRQWRLRHGWQAAGGDLVPPGREGRR